MKTKKILSIITLIVLIVSILSIPSFAVSALPESPHNYPDNYSGEWEYVYSGNAKGLLVTFSSDTKLFETDLSGVIVCPNETVEDIFIDSEDIFEDYIAIFDGSGNIVDIYYGDELAGKTVFVSGNAFTIKLFSNASGNAYGFKVSSVKALNDNCFTVTYHTGVPFYGSYSVSYYSNSDPVCDTYGFYHTVENCAFSGWSSEENGKVEYNGGEVFPENMTDTELYAVWTPVLLKNDEIFYFSNSGSNFDLDGRNRYYLSKEDYNTMQLNIYKNFGLGPVPSVAISAVLAFYPEHFEWQGSCYGMSTCVALQHFNMIDMFSRQSADCVYNLEPNDEIISFINYYQSQAATSYLTENKAGIKDTLNYSIQLHEIYKAVKEGNIVLFSFYTGAALISSGHTVLLTGAYDDANGNHVLIAYDCNRPFTFRIGDYNSRFIIDSDYSEISYEGESLSAINWTDDFSQFESFDINGNGTPAKWYQAFFNHIINTIKMFFNFFASLF